MLAEAIFAAGCFWGIQSVFDNIPGVTATEVGYIGGNTVNPTYKDVCRGNTGHAEAVKITYDTEKIDYRQLLDIFFANHNPTTRNRQGPDIGTQYRSAIFYLSDNQRKEAAAKIKALNAAETFSAPIVTEIVPAATFYPAEDYHQKYLEKRGLGSCHI